MCRAAVAPDAEIPLVRLLDQMAARLAEEVGVPRETVMIGPVDFGPETEE
jgi:hypothetical protein